MNKIVCFLLIGFFVSQSAFSRDKLKPAEEYEKFKAKYAEEAAVYTIRREIVDFSVVNDSIVTKIHVYEELMHLGENTARYASDHVYTSSFVAISDLEAYTLVPSKKKYERLDVADFTESFDKNSSVFFDDSKEITFTFPSVQKGAKTVLQYTKTIKDPRLMHMYFIDTYIPVDQAEYTVQHDEAINIKSQLFNVEKVNVDQRNEQTPEGRAKLHFHSSDIEKIKFDRNCPSYRNLAAALYCSVASYTTNSGEEVQLNSSLDQLHAWYRTFVKDILHKDQALHQLVQSIVGDEEDTLEKVRKVYYWVQDNIKYIAFEDGMRGFVPHAGSYVVEKRYGDCKDMASAIVSMLRELDIDAHYTWVGTRDLPYRYTQVPDPITDNHMIASFDHEGKTYYLDATGQQYPLGLPTSMIQGKECLISLDETAYKVNQIPVIAKKQNIMTDSVNIVLENSEVKGTGEVTLTGYAKVFNSYKLIKASKKSVDNYVDRLLTKGSNKFQVADYRVDHVLDRDVPTKIHYDFNIKDYYREIGDKIYINLVLDKTMTDALLENRTVPLENDYKYINRNIVRFVIPEGYQLNALPEDVQSKDSNFGYKIMYRLNNDDLVVTKEFYLDYLVMETSDFESWNEVINEYAKACRKAIVLSKNL